MFVATTRKELISIMALGWVLGFGACALINGLSHPVVNALIVLLAIFGLWVLWRRLYFKSP
jgi:hypothetical protein